MQTGPLRKDWQAFYTKPSQFAGFIEKSANRIILLGQSNPPGFLKAFEKNLSPQALKVSKPSWGKRRPIMNK